MKLQPTQLASEYANLGMELLRQGQFEDAADAFRLVLNKTPSDGPAACNLGIALMKLGFWGEAEDATRRYIETTPDDAEGLIRLGIIRRKLGQLAGSIEVLRRAIAIDPTLAVAHKELGSSLVARGETEQAVESFRRALAAKRGYVNAWCGLAGAHEAQRKPGLALRVFLESLQHVPSDKRGPIYARLGRMYRKIGQWKHARVALEKALEKGENEPQLYYELGSVFSKLGNTRAAQDQIALLESRGAIPLARALRVKIQEAESRPLKSPPAPAAPSKKTEEGLASRLKGLFGKLTGAKTDDTAPDLPDFTDSDLPPFAAETDSPIGFGIGVNVDDSFDLSIEQIAGAKVIELAMLNVEQAEKVTPPKKNGHAGLR